jgi:hypothetical protein
MDATFFGKNDHWDYVEDWGYTWTTGYVGPCEVCKGHGRNHGGKYTGTHLRATFPYLEILDENTIQVNAHPNCRCALIRTIPTMDLSDIDWS